MKRYENKTVVVTGSSRGLGAATIRRFASEGANVVINYTKNKEAAEKLVQEIKSIGVKTLLIQADVGSEESVKNMVSKVIEAFGTIDVLVNNAGIVFDVPFTEKTTEQ